MEFSSLLSGSSKRAKTPVNGNNISVSCLVDGCYADLSRCREYHRRHKVCELHSKTPTVTIGGREQRFCQQCSRFHSLAEFDEGKRSCRKRLDGHNRRRRKPQSNSMARAAETFLSSQQGTMMLSFNSPHIHPTAVVVAAWAGVAKPQNATVSSSRPPAQNHNKTGVNRLQFVQCGPQLTLSSAHHRHQNDDSSRALSLLSPPPPPPHQTPDIMQPSPQCRLGQYDFVQEMENETFFTDSDGDNNDVTLKFEGMFVDDVDESSSIGAQQQTMSFELD